MPVINETKLIGHHKNVYLPCPNCGKLRWTEMRKGVVRKYCPTCNPFSLKGDANPNWIGGYTYVRITTGEWVVRKQITKSKDMKRKCVRHKERMLTDPIYRAKILARQQKYRDKHYVPKIRHHMSYDEIRKRINTRDRKQRLERRIRALALWGDSCIVCGKKGFIAIHKIDFKPHIAFANMSNTDFEYALKHKDDYESRCNKHHKLIHLRREV